MRGGCGPVLSKGEGTESNEQPKRSEIQHCASLEDWPCISICIDVRLTRYGQCFVWDSGKASLNQAKHGLSFETACDVFFDPLIRFANAQVNDQSRDAAIGMDVTRRLLFVVHLLREDDCLRIISARMATATERKAYEDYD